MEKAGSLSYHEGYGIQYIYKRQVFEYKEGLEDGSLQQLLRAGM